MRYLLSRFLGNQFERKWAKADLRLPYKLLKLSLRSYLGRTGSFLGMMLATIWLSVACSAQQSALTIKVTSAPWPGYAAHYVAAAKDFFKAEGVTVQDIPFAAQGDADTAFLAGRADLDWTGLPNTLTLINRDPSIQVIMQCDYSNGADGILGRNIKTAADLKGKTVALENILIEELMLRRYLAKIGLQRNDVKTISLTAADAATAFATGKVDVAVTFEPWMTKAAKEGKGEIIFTSENSNIIPDGVIARKDFVEKHPKELQAYFRAIEKAVTLIQEKPEEAMPAIAKALGVSVADVPPQLAGVKLYNIQMNKDISFKAEHPMGLFESLNFASKTATETKLIPQAVDVKAALNPSVINAL
jgi:NitT/TauT family transport system substrate-binding protein